MVVVNTHLYGAHLASGGAVLPPHDVVVFDEAHEVEEVMTDSLGVEIGPGRFRALAATARPLLDPAAPAAVDTADAVAEVADRLQRALVRWPAAASRATAAGADAVGPGRDEAPGEPAGREPLGSSSAWPVAPARARAPAPGAGAGRRPGCPSLALATAG